MSGKCLENCLKIVQTNSGQIPETECPEIVPKRVHFPTFRICPKPVFVQNFKWKLSRKHPDFSF